MRNQFATITADTTAGRLIVIADDLWPDELGHAADVHGGGCGAQITVTRDRVPTLGAELTARGIDWGF